MHSFSCRFILSVLFVAPFVTSRNEQIWNARIYQNLAEIIQPLEKLPLQFTIDEWNSILPHSLTLLGENLTVISQRLTHTKKSSKNVQVYIRSPLSKDKTNTQLIKATLVDRDQYQYVVKVKNKSITDQVLYFTVSPQDIFYLDNPIDATVQVDFTYHTSSSKVFLKYCRSDLIWQRQYKLIMHGETVDLIATAGIQNMGNSFISINRTELMGHDLPLPTDYGRRLMRDSSQVYFFNDNLAFPKQSQMDYPLKNFDGQSLQSSFEFSLNRSLVIDAQTNYVLPIPGPKVQVEQYYLIPDSDLAPSISAAQSSFLLAKRQYRLISDRYLLKGHCILQEYNRVLGEIFLPNIAAGEKYEFSIGYDADVLYAKNMTKIAEDPLENSMRARPTYSDSRLRQCVYVISIHLRNLRSHTVQVEYTSTFYDTTFIPMESTDNHCLENRLSVKCKFILDKHSERVYSYKGQKYC